MATAVRTIEVREPLAPIGGLEGYRQVLILVRLAGCPVGQLSLPVVNGRVSPEELRRALLDLAGGQYCEQLVRDELELPAALPAASVKPSATVAVCTRDRTADLERCLTGLLRLPDDGQELLIVDNCPSSEETQRLVASHPTVRYVREDRPGASAARNRALREARGEVIAFTDDDATPDAGWLRGLLSGFTDPLVYCVTGLTMPLELELEAQEAFERYSPFGRGFQRRVFDSRVLPPSLAALVGASVNAAFRRRILDELGPFDEALGPGTPAKSGEDTDMFSRILAAGYRIVYEPSALCWHRHRRTWEELRQTQYGYGVGTYAAWTRALLVEHEWTVPRYAWAWFRYGQLPALRRWLSRRPGHLPIDLILAELHGCSVGPWAYLSRRRTVERNRPGAR